MMELKVSRKGMMFEQREREKRIKKAYKERMMDKKHKKHQLPEDHQLHSDVLSQVHEIMLIVATAAKSTEMKKIGTQSPPFHPFPQGLLCHSALLLALCFAAKKSSIYRLQGVREATTKWCQRIDERSNWLEKQLI